MRIGSRREVMERLGKSNIPELLVEIDEDAMRQAVIQQQIQRVAMGMGGNEPPQETPGEETPSNEENVEKNGDEDSNLQ